VPPPRPARARCLLALLVLALATVPAGCGGGEKQAEGPKPGKKGSEKNAAQALGFPTFATKNTTRVGGADPTADAAGVALATYPSQGGTEGPPAVTLVEEKDWQGGIAASVLMAQPIGAPILLTSSDGLPAATSDALKELEPKGAARTANAQVFRIGDAKAPEGLRTRGVRGSNPAAVAAEIDQLRGRLTGKRGSENVLIVSQDNPSFAMPAAAWAARSGEPVLFVQRNSVPKATEDALSHHRGANLYILGPSSVISSKAFRELGAKGRNVRRVSGESAVENAIAFSKYVDGTFGWDFNDPGHGFVIANAQRPLDAAAAVPLSARGKWGPLLLTNSATDLPAPLRGYLLDLKPGYKEDPTRAVFNHVWLIGDEKAIDARVGAQIDELVELEKVRTGPATPAPETEHQPGRRRR
jgi:putative cell wall binding repeat protein